MDTFEKSLNLIDKYFAETKPEIINEELSKYDLKKIEGVTFDEYICNFPEHFSFDDFSQPISPSNSFSTLPLSNNQAIEKIEWSFESSTNITVNDFSSKLQQDYTNSNSSPLAA
jgi:hypothetical protein